MQPEPLIVAVDRLEETGGRDLLRSPCGWLIRQGPVQRRACSHTAAVAECDVPAPRALGGAVNVRALLELG
ncbi:hypothetical protein AB0D24_23680 [Streptomyces javensis]|uniref:hypothetical protein n=1 Tax=Streptomyces javensis TaxID=114698 RepID=UPI0033EC38A0